MTTWKRYEPEGLVWGLWITYKYNKFFQITQETMQLPVIKTLYIKM